MQTLQLQGQEPFSLEVGTLNLFIGENGAGKTRLMQAIQDQCIGSFRTHTPELPIYQTKVLFWVHSLSPEKREELDRRALDLSKHFNTALMPDCCEGALHVFYTLALLLDTTPEELFIKNFGVALNPMIVRNLVGHMYEIAQAKKKRLYLTTHHPAALDGINLHDNEQRLFVVSRNDQGHTVVDRIKVKPEVAGVPDRLKLSELWMRGHLGGLAQAF